jgi:signal transduction histidine kinase/CheY-like chemotaxis protein/HPt (histidine-containing phosphotransfer) domain-containing protein
MNRTPRPVPKAPPAVDRRPAKGGSAPRRTPIEALRRFLGGAGRGLQRLSRVRGFGWLGDARILMTFGLVSLVVSALLVASWIGLMPDSRLMRAEARASLAEVVAAGSMGALAGDDTETVRELLVFAIERNPGLKSAAIRRADALVVEAGPHADRWLPMAAGRSTDEQLVVPLYASKERWGQLEMRFDAAEDAWWRDPSRQLIALVALSCFCGFYLYLGRMLRQLDPSRAVPDRVRGALDTLAEGLLLIDAQGDIVLANAAFCELLGQPAAAFASQPASGLAWTHADGSAFDPARLPWAVALSSGQTLKLQPVSIVGADGERRAFLANCAPVGADAGSPPAGVLVSLDDITELQHKEAQLREATARAEAANSAKTDFLANMSHEIRTPMNAILGFTEMLRRGRVSDPAQARRHLDTVHANGSHLLALINDILDLSKVEAGQFQVERIACAPHEVIAEVIEAMSVRASEKGIGLRRAVDGPVPAEILGDPSRLRQVITNLVGNAIKFTSEGEVVVTERWLPPQAGGAPRLEIAISDSGIGIPQDKLGAIFEPFVQAETSTARRFGGTGLGLAISRRFARAMGGDVAVTSTPGRGSTFSVTIDPGPLAGLVMLEPAQALAEAARTDAVAGTQWRFPPKRLLVVDDSPENRELVLLVLQGSGLVIEEADSGQAALDRVAAQRPDLILMDMQMPGMDGYTATRRLRAAGIKIPVLAFTAHALQGFETEILEAGCDGFLTKPIDIDAMLETLAARLGGMRVAAPAAAAASDAGMLLTAASHDAVESAARVTVSAPRPAGTMPPAAVPVVSRLAASARFAPIVAGFALRLPARIAEMRTAFDAGDASVLAEVAHWLKGSAGSVGFDAFTVPAREVENAARAGRLVDAAAPLAEVESLAARVVAPVIAAQPATA